MPQQAQVKGKETGTQRCAQEQRRGRRERRKTKTKRPKHHAVRANKYGQAGLEPRHSDKSTLFPKKKSARLEKLSKPPQGASKLASFHTVLAVRTLAVTFFFLRRTCSCRLSASLSSHLTPDQLVLSNTVLQPNKIAFRQPSR